MGQDPSVFVRATRGIFLTIEPFFSVFTDLFTRVVLFLCAKAADRARYASRIIPIRHGGGVTVGFFFPCLVLAGKRAAELLRLHSSKRVVERRN